MAETTDNLHDRAKERFRDFLARKGLRITNQRLAIFEAAYATEDHYTAEELLDAAREIDRSVSRATVYRSLPILTESGVVREIDVGRDYKFYVTSRGQRIDHAQVICSDCDKIYEIEAPFLEWYAKSIAQKVGLEADSQRLQVYAHCPRTDACPRERHDCPASEKAEEAAVESN